MKAILTITEETARTVAVVDINKYNIQNKIEFICAVLNVIPKIDNYDEVFNNLETNGLISISTNNNILLYLTKTVEY